MKDSSYRRLNALGFLCCLSFLVYLVVCLQTPVSGHATPFSSLTRIVLLTSSVLFFLPTLHNPSTSGQRFYGSINFVLVVAGTITSARHLWLQAKPEQISGKLVELCEQSFEILMAQQPAFSGKVLLLFDLSGNCIAEKLGPFPVSFPIQALLCFLLLSLLCWKILVHRPRSQGMFQ